MTGKKSITVSELTNAIKADLEVGFAGLAVAGEIVNYSPAASGHIYFSLKDAGAVIRCAYFRGFNLRRKFEPRDGLAVIAQGDLSVHMPKGEYQLIVQELIPQGIGEAELALRQLQEKLLKRGWFAPERKRKLPKYPRRIGMVTSATGDAVRDMLELLAKRWPIAEVIVRPSLVQGAEAPAQIATAIRQLNDLHTTKKLRLDAIILGRGGGSMEDLAAFNEEIVAQAIVESAVPVISAIGHETDYTIADKVADYRALTPSQAIVALCPNREELLEQVQLRFERMIDTMRSKLELRQERLSRIADRPVFRKPLERIRDAEQTIDEWNTRLQRAMQDRLRTTQRDVQSRAERLDSLSPLKILARGYSLCFKKETQELVKSTVQLNPQERVTIRFKDGQADCTVNSIDQEIKSKS